jgi:two-component system, sensor histidine kinase and response regulator
MVTLRVLAVDDEPGMLSGITRALGEYAVEVPDVDGAVAFDVETAPSGEAALEHIAVVAPDIMLLDYKLPGINGLDVLRHVTEQDAETLTIMITAYASIETAITATKRGAYDFLPKPFTPADLRHAVRKAASRIMLARRARELEEEKKRIRFDFIRVLGHELKSPLSAVAGYLHVMRRHTLGDDLGAYERPVERGLVRLDQMRKLIEDLLDMTRIESGQKRRELTTVDLVAAARQSLELVETAAQEREIVLNLHVPEALSMHADAGEIDMILNNLVSNAVKYNRDEGCVDVTLAACDGGVEIVVADTGIGMKAEDVAKLFAEFVRIRNEKTRNILGSGLGLSILKRLAGLYGGDVTVESEPDKGSTFRVTLQEAGAERGQGDAS